MAANYSGAQAYRFELFEPQQAMHAPKKKEVPVGPQARSEWSKRRKRQRRRNRQKQKK